MAQKLKVAMVTPPWLEMPPTGYGGIEYVVHYLTIELRKLGVEIDLFSVKGTTTPCDKLHWYYDTPQYNHIHKSVYDAVDIPITQIMMSLNIIKHDHFDLIHDHNGFLGPAMMAHLGQGFPPVLHTLHGPFSNDEMVRNGMPDNRPMYSQFHSIERLYFNGISQAQLADAPAELKPRLVDVVYNSVETRDYPYETDKDDYYITLARFARDKGQEQAVRFCEELGYKLRMAGPVAGISNPRRLMLELANPLSSYRGMADFRYYSDNILPRLDPGRIEYVGNVSGEHKMKFIAKAKCLLFPIDWEEPFGLAVIEALACGTPVVAYRRGAMPEIIQHGKNGFLADNEAEFKDYMSRTDEIDPAACRRSVEQKFSAQAMAKAYLNRYQVILGRH